MDLFALSFTQQNLVGKIISQKNKICGVRRISSKKGLIVFRLISQKNETCPLPTDNFMPRLKEVA